MIAHVFSALAAVHEVHLTPYQAVGIPIALAGAVLMSIGAQLQHQGVSKVEVASGSDADRGLGVRHIMHLLVRPSWLIGTLSIVLAIILQLVALAFAPLIVVQPIGVVALIVTSVYTAKITGKSLQKKTMLAIGLCVGGVAIFVAVAAMFASEEPISTGQLVTVLIILAVVLVALGTGFVLLRSKFGSLFYIVSAGVLYGFVSTLAKVVINRVVSGRFEGLTIVCVVALVIAAALGAYFVQTAYSRGSADLVIAGLTVVDPMVAIGIGVIVLGEASSAPWWASIFFALSGAIAIAGVYFLARHQPEAPKYVKDEQGKAVLQRSQ